jgi:hypothetical protein
MRRYLYSMKCMPPLITFNHSDVLDKLRNILEIIFACRNTEPLAY